MYRTRIVQDRARQWRQFCRPGLRLAWGTAALWLGGLALLFQVAPAPEPAVRKPPVPVSWWPGPALAGAGGVAADLRAIGSPAAFALPTPAGFSHRLRTQRSRLTPPVQAVPFEPAFALDPPAAHLARGAGQTAIRFTAAPAADLPAAGAGVFPPRRLEPEVPRLEFPEGWESRLFANIDLNFGAWTNLAWSARIEMRFDGQGVPVSILLSQPSGWPEVDRRLARSANGWRLLEPAAPRSGIVAWRSPAAADAAAGEGAP
jgi:hypothetical protein